MQDRHGNTDSSLRGLLSRLFGGWGVGAGQAPTIGGENALSPETVGRGRDAMRDTMLAAQNRQAAAAPPMPMAPTDSQAQVIAQNNMNGPMNDANLPQFAPPTRPHPGGPMQGMHQGYAAPAGTLGGMPITEGQNANIGDDSRQRAMQMIAALRDRGAL